MVISLWLSTRTLVWYTRALGAADSNLWNRAQPGFASLLSFCKHFALMLLVYVSPELYLVDCLSLLWLTI